MNDMELLEAYEDWKAEQKYRDDGPTQFLSDVESQRLVRNATAVLKYLEDGVEDVSGPDIANTVWYLLNAALDDHEVEEWLNGPKATGQEWVAASGLDPAVIAAATTGQEWTPEEDDDTDLLGVFDDDAEWGPWKNSHGNPSGF